MPSLVRWNGDAFKATVNDRVTVMLDGMGRLVAEEAKRLCAVDTGQTRDSIGWAVRQSDKTVQIFAGTRWAVFLEFGTRRTRAQPFLRPALLAARNWSNRGVNTEMQFGAIQSPGTLPMPRANPDAIAKNERINRGLGRRFKGTVGSVIHKRPSIVFHGKTARSQTGRRTHAIHERFGG